MGKKNTVFSPPHSWLTVKFSSRAAAFLYYFLLYYHCYYYTQRPRPTGTNSCQTRAGVSLRTDTKLRRRWQFSIRYRTVEHIIIIYPSRTRHPCARDPALRFCSYLICARLTMQLSRPCARTRSHFVTSERFLLSPSHGLSGFVFPRPMRIRLGGCRFTIFLSGRTKSGSNCKAYNIL